MKTMNHAAYQADCRAKTETQLRFIIQNCQEVIRVQSDFNPNIGYYMDEIHYCSMELARRQNRK